MEHAVFINECRALSLTARAMIALLIVERFCHERSIQNADIDKFLEYMWQWPKIEGPEMFGPWEFSRPNLVDYGLGDSLPVTLEVVLSSANIPESQFRLIVSGAVEILWSSFYGAAEDEASLVHLERVVSNANVRSLPALIPFQCSRISEGNGWGMHPTAEDYGLWTAQRVPA